jgi:hypothetical protein
MSKTPSENRCQQTTSSLHSRTYCMTAPSVTSAFSVASALKSPIPHSRTYCVTAPSACPERSRRVTSAISAPSALKSPGKLA